ncbi:unnamed protein product, partial [Owenia fusiformis]
MAAAQSFIEESASLLMCPICLQMVSTPKSLKCLHTFCEGCLDDWIQKHMNNISKTYACPVCSCVIDIPAEGASSYRTNFTMQSMAEALDKTQILLEQDSFECGVCIHDDVHVPAVTRCTQCAKNLCRSCTKFHTRLKSTKSHILVELTGNPDKDFKITAKSLGQADIQCPSHPDQILQLYCKTDKTLICIDCCVGDHSGHKYLKVQEVAKDEWKNLKELMDQGNARTNMIDQKIKATVELRNSQNKNLIEVLEAIKAHRHSMITKINTHCDKLEIGAKTLHEKSLKQIDAQQSFYDLQSGKTKSTMLLMSSIKESSHPVEIIKSIPDIEQRVEDWKTEPIDSSSEPIIKSLTFQPGDIETANLGHLVSVDVIQEKLRVQDQQVAQENSKVQREKRAAKIILKQLLKLQLISKLYKIHLIRNKAEEKKVQHQQLNELETYGVDDSMCSICGIHFVQPLNPNLLGAVGLAAKSYMSPVPVGQMWVTEEDTKVQVLETSHTNTAEGTPYMNGVTKKSHIATFEHIQGALSYKLFTKICNERIIPASTRFANLKIMVGKVNNPKMVRLKELDVGTLETKYGALMDLFGQTTNARQWTRVEELEDSVGVIESELNRIGKIYQEVVQEMH